MRATISGRNVFLRGERLRRLIVEELRSGDCTCQELGQRLGAEDDRVTTALKYLKRNRVAYKYTVVRPARKKILWTLRMAMSGRRILMGWSDEEMQPQKPETTSEI